MRYFTLFIFLLINIAFGHDLHIEKKSNTKIELTKIELEFIKKNPIVKVGVEDNWPPFEFIENGKYDGIVSDYLNLIAQKTGLEFSIVSGYKWSELLDLAKNKEIDLLPALAKNKERENFLKFTKSSYLVVRDYIFATNNRYRNFGELKNKRLAIPKGFIQVDYIKNNYPEVEIVLVDNILEAMDYNLLGKVDAFLSNIALVDFISKRNNILNIKPQFLVGQNDPLYMAVSNNNDILISILDKALKSILVSERNDISNKWIASQQNLNNIVFTKKEKEFISIHPTLKVANEYDWIPFDYFEDNKPKGYVIDYIKLLFTKIGIQPEFVTDSWTKLYRDFNHNKIDILPVISYSEERETKLNYTKPYINLNFSVVTKNTRNDLVNMDDLIDKKLAVVKSWTSSKRIKENYPNIKIIEFDSLVETFDAVKNNLVDATIHSSLLSTYYINEYYHDSLKKSFYTKIKGHDNNLYMGLTKKYPILQSIIDKAMTMITDDELKNLQKKWLSESKRLFFTEEELNFMKNNIINVGYTDNWAPFSFEENGKPYGLGFDFWKYIVEHTNLKVNLEFKNNFTSALKDLKEKQTDILITTSKTKDREAYSIFSDIYYRAPIGIATLQDRNYIPDASYLIGKKVGVGKNYTAHKLLQNAYPDMKFVYINNIKEGLEFLSNNKIDALVDIMPVLTHNIEKYAYSNIKISGDTGVDFSLQMMIRDDYKLLQSIVNKVLISMKPSEKKEIYNKWSNLEYKKEFDYSILWKYFLPLILIIIYITYKNRQLIQYQKNLKRTKKELENTVENFKTLVNLTIEGIIIVKNEKILFFNSEASKMFEVLNLQELNIKNLFDSKNRNLLDTIIEENQSSTYELIGLRNNMHFPILLKSKGIVFENENCTILSIIDMSEIKDKENLLIQQSKMASLGEMIANIAHQWRQPLSFISTASTGMKLQKEYGLLDDKLFNKTIDEISETTQFLSQTIDDFQNYLKNDKNKSEFLVRNSLEKVLNIVNGSLSTHSITIKLDVDNNLKIVSYENELTQVLLNIINNSKDALKELENLNRFIEINVYKEDKKIKIEIIDNGGGIDEEIINKVFDPYFTTKHKSQGTGLGLYMTHKIISESLNGLIKISNIKHIFDNKQFDSCTKVNIVLPIS